MIVYSEIFLHYGKGSDYTFMIGACKIVDCFIEKWGPEYMAD